MIFFGKVSLRMRSTTWYIAWDWHYLFKRSRPIRLSHGEVVAASAAADSGSLELRPINMTAGLIRKEKQIRVMRDATR